MLLSLGSLVICMNCCDRSLQLKREPLGEKCHEQNQQINSLVLYFLRVKIHETIWLNLPMIINSCLLFLLLFLGDMGDVTETWDVGWEDRLQAVDECLLPSCVGGCQSQFRAWTSTRFKWTGRRGQLWEQIWPVLRSHWTANQTTFRAAVGHTWSLPLTYADQHRNHYNREKGDRWRVHLVGMEVFSSSGFSPLAPQHPQKGKWTWDCETCLGNM